MSTADVIRILEAAPEFAPRYLELVEAADGDPGPAVVLEELADHVAALLRRVAGVEASLARCLAAVEEVARASGDAEELVVWGFLDHLSPDDLRRLGPWLGTATRGLTVHLEGP